MNKRMCRRTVFGPMFGGANLLAVSLFLGVWAATCWPASARAARWQYRVPFEETTDRGGKPRQNYVAVWLPPNCQVLRGLYISQTLGIESELQLDSEVRKACADSHIAIVRLESLGGLFKYWEPDNRDPDRLLRALDVLAEATGHAEIRRVPWITAGHSTNGIFCRNVAYWRPDRVAAVVHIKSGNFHQKNVKPPQDSLAGVPLLALNGQLETYGPETGIDPAWGRETQWVYVRQDIWKFRAQDPNHLMSIAVQPGDDHFHGSPEVGRLVALFIRKTAAYRLPKSLTPGQEPVRAVPVALESGWLSDADLHAPQHRPAPYDQYTGDRLKAMWHYDGEMAAAVAEFHKNLAKHQVLDNPKGEWLDEGDGWTFRVRAEWLTVWPEKFGGKLVNQPIGHAATPFVYRAKQVEPVLQLSPDTFQLLRQPGGRGGGVSICAYHPGDERYRATYRWGSLPVPQVKGAKQQIEFPDIPDLKADITEYQLRAKSSSGLPIHYEVDYGPIAVEGDRLKISDLPVRPRFPIPCRVTAYQLGRRTGEAIEPAPPVSKTFAIVR
jgi:hypothetical protein